MAFTFSVNAFKKETEKTINYQEKKKKRKHLPMQWQKIACNPISAVTLTQSWTHPDLVLNKTAQPLKFKQAAQSCSHANNIQICHDLVMLSSI